MKGIVVEKNNENCVLLLSDGTFKTVKNTDELQIGLVIYMNSTEHSNAFYLKKMASMVAAVLIVAFIGLGAYSWTVPVQYISIDINPSVELVINYYNRIIRMEPLNDDGERLLASVDLQLKKYEKGVNEIIETAKDLGYLANEWDVLISVSSSNSELRQKTQEEIEKKVSQQAEVLTFDSAEHDRSVQEGLSPGKSKIIGKVMESGTNLTEEELADASVKDLMLRIKENKKLKLELDKEAKQQEKKQKEMEKAGRKEQDEPAVNKNNDHDNEAKGNNKPDKTGKADDKSKENDKKDDKQKDKDITTNEDKTQENNGSNHSKGQDNTSADIKDNKADKTKQKNDADQEEPSDKDTKSKDNTDVKIKSNNDDKSKQKSDADQEKSSDKDTKNKEKDGKSSDNGNDKNEKDKDDADVNKNNKKDTGGETKTTKKGH